jgi:hypothetical protein
VSTTGVFRCCDDRRRERVRAQTPLNGIDYLEVVDHDEPVQSKRQRFLRIHFIKSPPPAAPLPSDPFKLKDWVVIEGGERIRNIVVKDAQYDGDVLVVEVEPRGDFSPYTLRLVQPPARKLPLTGLDVPLSTIEFSFKVECESDFDCRVATVCPPEDEESPRIDYLARDYGSFRRLMLDRISLLVPGWRERTPADLGVTLVELLAYVADHLSYRQDAIATEAYLGTARKRTSVRRHARLVDYELRDGCNARVFVHVNVNNAFTLPAGTQFLTRVDGVSSPVILHEDLLEALATGPLVFESMRDEMLHPAFNSLTFYTWQSDDCCLPRGATSATLAGHPALMVGGFLLFGEVLGPETGNAEDADRTKRHVVRLKSVTPTFDFLVVPPATTPAPVTEIVWEDADALPFPLCISSTVRIKGTPVPFPSVSIAIGNLVIADHGRSIAEPLEKVPDATLFRPPSESSVFCAPGGVVAVTPRFNPRLSYGPLTHSAPLDVSSARAVLEWELAAVLPSVLLDSAGGDWEVRHDLLESTAAGTDFVADVEEDGLATLRFGDGEYGLRPASGTAFTAHYRVGNGITGNLGQNALRHVVAPDPLTTPPPPPVPYGDIVFIWNPIGGSGGVEPETLEHARRSAPAAFRIQERAVTEKDYAEVTERHPAVDRAAATFLWSGSWYTVFDSVDRPNGLEVDDAFRAEILGHVEKYRVIGKDLDVRSPEFVSLELALTICVVAGHFRAEVEVELRDVFTSGTRGNGQPGFFHPDNFTFGDPVILSRIIAAAMAVEGVDAVFVDRFRRQSDPLTDAIASGVLEVGRLEVIRLENSRDFPEHGSLSLTMRGGV